MESVWLGFLVLACFAASGDAIRCFQCNSAADPGCADLKQNDTHSKYFRECPNTFGIQPFFCRKTYIYLFDSKTARVMRNCGTEVNRKNESNCYRADTDYKAEISCQCFREGCNSVFQIRPSVLTVAAMAAVVLHYANI